MRQGGVMKIADAEAFGNELRTRRKELGYTQAYIAEFTGCLLYTSTLPKMAVRLANTADNTA